MSTHTPMPDRIAPPDSEAELLRRADALAGATLGEIARRLGLRVPHVPRHAKGWAGIVIEAILGATAASRPEPDFQHIGVELKTIPVDTGGRPLESTHVCMVTLRGEDGIAWETSHVWRKLRRVLWVPIAAERRVPMGERRIGAPLLWSPDADEEAALRADWEELMEMICLGQVDRITAHHGECLQIRPKAANSRARRMGVGETGESVPTLPRGFYLRASFTAAILRKYYV